MRYYKELNGIKVFFNGILTVGDKQIINPTREMLLEQGWQEYVTPTPTPYTPTYEEKVEQLIRLKYNINQELAIQRQRDSKPSEFAEYFTYCEQCKADARAVGEPAL